MRNIDSHTCNMVVHYCQSYETASYFTLSIRRNYVSGNSVGGLLLDSDDVVAIQVPQRWNCCSSTLSLGRRLSTCDPLAHQETRISCVHRQKTNEGKPFVAPLTGPCIPSWCMAHCILEVWVRTPRRIRKHVLRVRHLGTLLGAHQLCSSVLHRRLQQVQRRLSRSLH